MVVQRTRLSIRSERTKSAFHSNQRKIEPKDKPFKISITRTVRCDDADHKHHQHYGRHSQAEWEQPAKTIHRFGQITDADVRRWTLHFRRNDFELPGFVKSAFWSIVEKRWLATFKQSSPPLSWSPMDRFERSHVFCSKSFHVRDHWWRWRRRHCREIVRQSIANQFNRTSARTSTK